MLLYDSPVEAAKALAPIFKVMHWNWWNVGIPTELDILHSFNEFTLKRHELSSNSGRLTVIRLRDTGKLVYGLEYDSFQEWVEAKEI